MPGRGPAAVVLLCLAAHACGGHDTIPAEPSGSVSVAIVTPDVVDDGGWTQSLIDGVERLDHPVEINVRAETPANTAAEALRSAAVSADIVVAHHENYGSAVRTVAPEYPDTSFLLGATDDRASDAANVSTYRVMAGDGGFVLGTLAAALSTTGVVGVVASSANDQGYADGFVAAVEDAGPVDVVVGAGVVAVTEDRDGRGADVMAMATGPIPADAVAVVPMWFGNHVDRSAEAPAAVVASQVYRWEMMLARVIAQRDLGVLGGNTYVLRLANGGLDIVFNDDFDVPPGIKEASMITMESVIAGEIEPGS